VAVGPDAAVLTHGELEAGLASDGRELLRLLLQDHLDLRAHHEIRIDEVVDAGGVARTTSRPATGSWARSSGR
jgi:hypothetical protein